MRSQMSSLGLHFNWDREVSTCSPTYYKWTQWLFLQLYKHGLAYRKNALVNWDPVDKTVLANEQVDAEGRSWRSGALVEKKYLEQWFFKITDYAEPLLNGLETLEWPSSVKAMQRHWIGKSDGASLDSSLCSTPNNNRQPPHPSSPSSPPSPLSPSSPSHSRTFPNHCSQDILTEQLEREQFSSMSVGEGSTSIVDSTHSQGSGGHMTQYKLHDWLISRQRYWGTPIPILYCDKCGVVPVPESQLPVILPTKVEFKGQGPFPLTQDADWLRGDCGKPGCCARRETDTMDSFVDSSWYFLRFIDPHLDNQPFSEAVREWMPVDLYVGGIEHATLHLLYARFITHFLHDHGFLSHSEPFQKLLTQGIVYGKTYRLRSSGHYLTQRERERGGREGVVEEGDEIVEAWEKMSKSKHNGVDPEEVVRDYGADSVRLYMLFKAPPYMDMKWDIKGMRGIVRMLRRVWELCHEHIVVCLEEGGKDGRGEYERNKIIASTHQAIDQVTVRFQHQTLNVAVSDLMVFSNALKWCKDQRGTTDYQNALETWCLLLAPMAPHIASQLWEDLQDTREIFGLPKAKEDVLNQPWPKSGGCLRDRRMSLRKKTN